MVKRKTIEDIENIASETKAYETASKKKMLRTKNTLCLIMSLDGKISTHANKENSLDIEINKLGKISDGLSQFHEIEAANGSFVLSTGDILAQRGINEFEEKPEKTNTSYIVIDNDSKLSEEGLKYLSALMYRVIIVTTDKKHPANKFKRKDKHLDVITYKDTISYTDLFIKLREDYGIDKLTIQAGGSLNTTLFRNELIDYIDLVIAPIIIGGSDTSTIADGVSLKNELDNTYIKELELVKAQKLKNSYMNLLYKVNNKKTGITE